jgi:hypothetical protein
VAPGPRRSRGALWRWCSCLGCPIPPRLSVDAAFFSKSIIEDGTGSPRWYLLLWTYARLVGALRPWLHPFVVLRAGNTLLATAALLALAGAARRLGRTRGEVAAIGLLAWSAFGTLQLAIGYVDVYPFALAATAVYLWLGLAALAGERHPAWPFVAAAVGPIFYEGLVLLAPSLTVVAWTAGRRPGGGRRLGAAALAAALAAGLATVPRFGRPFAWAAYLDWLGKDLIAPMGLSATSALLPLDAWLSAWHLADVAHTLVLVDGVGVLLLMVAGGSLAARHWRPPWDAAAVFLGLVVLPYLAYLGTMDALWGAFADWDLFSFGAAATSLLGGYAFVTWGRTCPRAAAVLLGVALAAAGVHLLARLNALDVDLRRHYAESPFHVQLP